MTPFLSPAILLPYRRACGNLRLWRRLRAATRPCKTKRVTSWEAVVSPRIPFGGAVNISRDSRQGARQPPASGSGAHQRALARYRRMDSRPSPATTQCIEGACVDSQDEEEREIIPASGDETLPEADNRSTTVKLTAKLEAVEPSVDEVSSENGDTPNPAGAPRHDAPVEDASPPPKKLPLRSLLARTRQYLRSWRTRRLLPHHPHPARHPRTPARARHHANRQWRALRHRRSPARTG